MNKNKTIEYLENNEIEAWMRYDRLMDQLNGAKIKVDDSIYHEFVDDYVEVMSYNAIIQAINVDEVNYKDLWSMLFYAILDDRDSDLISKSTIVAGMMRGLFSKFATVPIMNFEQGDIAASEAKCEVNAITIPYIVVNTGYLLLPGFSAVATNDEYLSVIIEGASKYILKRDNIKRTGRGSLTSKKERGLIVHINDEFRDMIDSLLYVGKALHGKEYIQKLQEQEVSNASGIIWKDVTMLLNLIKEHVEYVKRNKGTFLSELSVCGDVLELKTNEDTTVQLSIKDASTRISCIELLGTLSHLLKD